MRLLRTLGLLACFGPTAALSQSYTAPGTYMQSGLWEGYAHGFEASEALSHCSFGVSYKSGSSLMFKLYSSGRFELVLIEDRIRAEPNELRMSMVVDQAPAQVGTGNTYGQGIVGVFFHDVQEAMNLIGNGRVMTLGTAYGETRFNLTGTRAMLEKLRQCVLLYQTIPLPPKHPRPPAVSQAAPPTSPAPVQTAAAPAPPKSAPDSAGVLYQVATAVAVDFGLKNIKYDPYGEIDTFGDDYVSWRDDSAGLAGIVAITATEPDAPLSRSDALDLVAITAMCKGSLATKTTEIELNGLKSRRIEGMCIQSDDLNFTVEVSKVQSGSTLLRNLTLVKDGANYSRDADRTSLSNDSLIRAASYLQPN